MPDSFQWLLLLGAFLFSTGLAIVVCRRNLILMLMGLELMLNGANMNWVAFGRLYPDALQGEIFALFVIVVAVCEAAVGIALIVQVYQHYQVSVPDQVADLNEN
jgi:NADH:ubiquinone oxidoreductase subunit K